MYEFIRIQYILGRLSDIDVTNMVLKGYINSEQVEKIIKID